jgi:hypothetical protein
VYPKSQLFRAQPGPALAAEPRSTSRPREALPETKHLESFYKAWPANTYTYIDRGFFYAGTGWFLSPAAPLPGCVPQGFTCGAP